MRQLSHLLLVGPLEPLTRLRLVALTVLFGTLLTAGSLLRPPFDVPDERFHFDVVTTLMEGGGFPAPGSLPLSADTEAASRLLRGNRTVDTALPHGATFDESTRPCIGRPLPSCSRAPRLEELEAYRGELGSRATSGMTQHPPLFYAATGAVTTLVTGMIPDAVGIDLLVFVMRMISAAWLLPLPVLAFGLGRQLDLDERQAVVGASWTLLPVSLTGRVGPMVNNDTMTITVAALLLLLTAVVVTRRPSSVRAHLLLGAVAGIGLLVKGLLLPFAAVVVLAPILSWLRGDIRARRAARLMVAGGASLLMAGGWWPLRNLALFGTFQPIVRIANREPDTFSASAWVLDWVTTLLKSFFGAWIPWSQSPVLWIVVVALAGMLAFGVASARERRLILVLALPPAATLAAVALTSYRIFAERGFVSAAQGRYLLVGIPLLGVLATLGLTALTRAAWLAQLRAPVVIGAIIAHQVVGLTLLLNQWGPPGGSLSSGYTIAQSWSPIGPRLFTVTLASAPLLALAAWWVAAIPSDRLKGVVSPGSASGDLGE